MRDASIVNGHAMSRRMRDELVSQKDLHLMWEIHFMLEDHRRDVNHHPQGSLANRIPVDFVLSWRVQTTLPSSQLVYR
jgi:hypothetical protein